MARLENLVPPPLLCALVALAMWLVARVTPAMGLGDPARTVAVVVLSAGGLVGALGLREFRRAKTTVDPLRLDRASQLVTSGVYRLTRNPMYVGLTSLLLAWGVYLTSPAALLCPALFAALITRFQIMPEERAMASLFGETYVAYRKRVRRWL